MLRKPDSEHGGAYAVAAFYRFLPISDPAAQQARLKETLAEWGLCGTLLLAPEGINGTLAGSERAVDALLGLLEAQFGLPRAEVKLSAAADKPFARLKVRVKREIVSFGQASLGQTGTYVAAANWNALLADPDVLVLDTRNRYETRLGTFENAADPQIDSFREFAAYAAKSLDPAAHPKIAMFCTGGIRCEKASAFLLARGFAEVYHLKGGILTYLEDVPAAQSRWQGECYVFDGRMSVGPDLAPGRYGMCWCCGDPVSAEDRAHADYEEGVSCPRCFANTSEADKARYRMRQTQMSQSKVQGE